MPKPTPKRPLPVKRIIAPERVRFLTKFTRGTDITDCWEWIGTPGTHGYGTFSSNLTAPLTPSTPILAHRYSYEMFVGPIPEGLWIDHLCRNRICVNPLHLEPVTPAENKRRGESILAINARKTHCKWGHEFTPENTARVAKGRHCRRCHWLQKRGLHPRQLTAAGVIAAGPA